MDLMEGIRWENESAPNFSWEEQEVGLSVQLEAGVSPVSGVESFSIKIPTCVPLYITEIDRNVTRAI